MGLLGKPLLGIGFEALYPLGNAPITVPRLDLRAPPAHLIRLIEYLPTFEVWIYPLFPAPERRAHIAGWLLSSLVSHFERAGIDGPCRHAQRAAELIHVHAMRPEGVRLVLEGDLANGLPDAAELMNTYLSLSHFWTDDAA